MNTKKPAKNATLRDIAKAANVSHTTVSLALADPATTRVSTDTRNRILAIAAQYNYRPNPIARSLVHNQTKNIGLIVTTLLNPFYAEMAQDIINRAKETGYGVSTGSARDLEEERQSVEGFFSRGVDGLIICSAHRRDPVVAELIEAGRPFVLAMRNVDRSAADPPVSFVGLDNERGAFMAVEHLASLGHRRIGLIAGPNDISTGRDRLAGARAGCLVFGLEAPAELCRVGDFTRGSGYREAQALLDAPEPPTAIFAMNDHMAIGVLEAARSRGLEAPGDLSVIGFDDINIADIHGISLTTISQKKSSMGRLAVDLIVDIMKGESDRVHKNILLEPLLVVRGSTGRPCRPGP